MTDSAQTVTTVQYTTRNLSPIDGSLLRTLLPSRGLPSFCLNISSNSDPTNPCYLQTLNKHDVNLPIGLQNSTEYAKLLANKSEVNQILRIEEGSVIIPAATPSDIDFDGSTFGSSTNCSVATNLCEIYPVLSPGTTDYSGPDFNDTFYNCTLGKAGFNLIGTFSDVIASTERDVVPAPGLAVQYFTDASRSVWNGSDPANSTRWFALLFAVETSYIPNSSTLNELVSIANTTSGGLSPEVGIPPIRKRMEEINATFPDINGKDGMDYLTLDPTPIVPVFGLVPLYNLSELTNAFGGILSCATKLSDVVRTTYSRFLTYLKIGTHHLHIQTYSFDNGSFTNSNWTLMNDTAGAIFAGASEQGQGSPQLQQGIRTAVAGANEVEDIASGFANAYDQTALSMVAGMLPGLPPTNVTQRITMQVTRIPRAPFLALMILDFTYAVISTGLFLAALIAIRRGDRVADAQARLSIEAVIAESFENPAWGEDAKSVDELFAERRGQRTRKIAIVKRNGGGRRFKPVITAPTSRSRG